MSKHINALYKGKYCFYNKRQLCRLELPSVSAEFAMEVYRKHTQQTQY